MGDWQKWVAAGIMVMMVVYIFPRAKHMLKESPKGSTNDWTGFLVLIAVVALFVVLLTQLV
jgi:hypothetical protein